MEKFFKDDGKFNYIYAILFTLLMAFRLSMFLIGGYFVINGIIRFEIAPILFGQCFWISYWASTK